MTSNELSTLVTGLWSKVKSYISNIVSNKQDTLVSGTNIKTINNTSLLGSGNISISGGGSDIDVIDNLNSTSATDALSANQGKTLKGMLDTYCPIIEDTRSSAVAEITGVAPFSELIDGQIICLHFNAGYGKTLELTLGNGTTTGAKNVLIPYRSSFYSPADVGVSSKSYMLLRYEAANNVWRGFGSDKNSVYNTITQEQINAGTATGGALITPKQLVDNFEKRHLYVDNSADASVELSTATYNDLGTLSTWKPITLPAAYNRGDEFVFRFECGDASLTPTLPQGVVMADNFEWSEMAVGVVFQVSIFDGEAAYLCLTPNS